jgi:hypothetical protein
MISGLTILITIFLCLAFGIYLGLLSVRTVLAFMRYRPATPAIAANEIPVLHPSGD